MAVDPDVSDVQRFREGDDGRPFAMVQLLRFVPGGRERYLAYSRAAQPILARLGAQVLYAGECTEALMRDGEPWDALVVVRWPNRTSYAEMLSSADYIAIAPMRREALQDAVFLPMNAWPGR